MIQIYIVLLTVAIGAKQSKEIVAIDAKYDCTNYVWRILIYQNYGTNCSYFGVGSVV